MKQLLTAQHSRRQFINGLVTASLGASILGAVKKAHALSGMATYPNGVPTLPPLPAPMISQGGEVRDLHLYNPNTRETANIRFFANGEYNPQALQQLNVFMRDFHENVPYHMDPNLLTMVHDMQKVFDMRQIHVISAYRTRATNNQLVRKHVTSAKDSFHCKGQAIDIRIPGVPTSAMREVAKILGVGGVGYYPWAHFVHVDTGPVRYW